MPCYAVVMPLVLARVNTLDLFIITIHLEEIGVVSVALHDRYNPVVTLHVLSIVASTSSLKSYFTIIVKANQTEGWDVGYKR